MRIASHPKLLITQNDEGLRIHSKHPNGVYLNYNYDGKFERNKRDYKIHQEPVTIYKGCPFHSIKNGPISIISSAVGGTEIRTLKNLNCQYAFTLIQDHNGGFTSHLITEFLFYFNDEEFIHVNTWFHFDETRIYKAKFYSKIDEMLVLDLPATNMKAAQTIEQLVDKVKLFTLFS
jgi:hypothetical protein